MKSLEELIKASAALHNHLCPRQVLGVRMGMLAGELLHIDLPQSDKRLLAIVETDGCFADGVAVAANCWVGRRTLRVEDYGKVAVVFVDTQTGHTVRIAPHLGARQAAQHYAPEAASSWEAMLVGYQRMPSAELLATQTVQLVRPVASLISQAGKRAICACCGEEIINERELRQDGRILCRACAGDGYYITLVDDHVHQLYQQGLDHIQHD